MTFEDMLEVARRVCSHVFQAGGRGYIVGGAARDMWAKECGAWDEPIKDIDIEIHGINPVSLKALLEEKWALDEVGKQFSVVKLKGVPIDISVPRRETKTGPGHKDFVVEFDPNATLFSAAARRDFTINAIFYDPLLQDYSDPYRGMAYVQAKILVPTSEKFDEDALRVLRGMQFIARFGLTPSDSCIALCRDMTQEHLPRERLFEEWSKFFLRGKYMTAGLEFLRQTGWMERFYPELFALTTSEQNEKWHPESKHVYGHFCEVLEAFAKGEFKDDEEKLILGLAALCHDLGKPATAVFGPTPKNEEPHWTNKGHAEYLEPTYAFLNRITNETKLVSAVVSLVKHHMKPMDFYRNNANLSSFRRLACEVDLNLLAKLSRFDQGGRGPTMPVDEVALKWFTDKALEAQVLYNKPVPLVMGRDLLGLMTPGKAMGAVLKAVMEKQLNGEITTREQGVEFAKTLIT